VIVNGEQDSTPGTKRPAWWAERIPLSGVLEFLKDKTVPWHNASIFYLFGGAALLLFCVQVMTGIMLMFYYIPTPDTAHETVLFISSKVPFGWLIRSIHSWSANLMVLVVFIHMFSVYFMRGYTRPRELIWVTGALLLVLSMTFGFSGYLLPWTKLSYFATKIGTDLSKLVPFIGDELKRFLLGADAIGAPTLTRFYALHVAILPPIFSVVLLVHLALIQLLGMSEHGGKGKSGSLPFFPNFFLREAMVWVVFLGLLAVLSVYWPWEVGEKADPLASAPAGIRPEWFFTFLSQSLKYIPAKVLGIDGEVFGVYLIGLGGMVFLLVPFWDRWAPSGKNHWLVTVVGVVALVYLITLTGLAYLKPY
jgi:cytochrome b6